MKAGKEMTDAAVIAFYREGLGFALDEFFLSNEFFVEFPVIGGKGCDGEGREFCQ